MIVRSGLTESLFDKGVYPISELFNHEAKQVTSLSFVIMRRMIVRLAAVRNEFPMLCRSEETCRSEAIFAQEAKL